MTTEPDLNDRDTTVRIHRHQHQQHGTIIHVEFPPEAPFDVVEAALDAVAAVTDVDREGWDPFVYATRQWGRHGSA